MKTLGILGGLGPMAGIYFAELLTRKTKAAADQEHLRFLLYSNPATPDRTGFILGESSEDPLPVLAESLKKLESSGAEVIAIPCMTSHFFFDELQRAVEIPVLNGIRETAFMLSKRGIQRAGILATTGTIHTGLFQKAFRELGMEALIPGETDQKAVMDIIYNEAKAGKPISADALFQVSDGLLERGAQICVLGCTELSLALKEHLIPKEREGEFLDVLDALSEAAVLACGAELES